MSKSLLSGAKFAAIVFAANIAGYCLVGSAQVSAETARARLRIKPIVCVIDVVQDGSEQSLQVPPNCHVVIPNILTPVLEEEPREGLPFAGEDADGLAPVVRLETESGPWSPIASTVLEGQPSSQTFSGLSTMAVGVGVVAAVTAIAVDAALFELGHSKSVIRWARSRFWLPFSK